MNLKIKKKKFGVYPILIVFALLIATAIVIIPLLILISTSLKGPQEFMTNPAGWPHKLYLNNYPVVFLKAKIYRAMGISLLVSSSSIAGVLLTGSLVSYALTKMGFKREKLFSSLFLIPLIFPAQSILIPVYFGFLKLHLTNNLFGLIILYIASGLPMMILILTGFMKTIPTAISESAFVEGASHFRVYLTIILPLVKPAIATSIIVSGLSIWNDFFLPLIFITKNTIAPLPLAVFNFQSGYSSDWGKIATCLVFLVFPIVVIYIFLQRFIINGVIAGAVKS